MKLNIYLISEKNLVETIELDNQNISTIEEARILIVRKINKNYPEVKYRINIFTTFEGEKTINVFFEDNILMKRDFLLKNILE